jgi:putative phosphoribosyl transferase
MTSALFRDRRDAGQKLAERLRAAGWPGAAGSAGARLLALPRGGVPVAAEIARALALPLDVFLVRKLGAPDNPEYGIGALAEGGHYWVNPEPARALGLRPADLQPVVEREARELARRVRAYRGDRARPDLRGAVAVLVDDGLATGVTAAVAARAVRSLGAGRVIMAVPVCSAESARLVGAQVDELVCLAQPSPFFAVGSWYEDFSEVSDAEVLADLADLREVRIPTGSLSLEGELAVPPAARGIVLFAHGSGSSRHSPRNRSVARGLQARGLATLLIDLLTPEEARDRRQVFDVERLARRLRAAIDWLRAEPATRGRPLGLFGASTGAAAALLAAAEPDTGRGVAAIVSRGGRPDLAGAALARVEAPTLLIVGGHDEPVLELNRRAEAQLPHARLIVIPGATHLFEEPGALEQVTRTAGDWFLHHGERHGDRRRDAA